MQSMEFKEVTSNTAKNRFVEFSSPENQFVNRSSLHTFDEI